MSQQIYYTTMDEPFTVVMERDENNFFTIKAYSLPLELEIFMGSVRFRVCDDVCQILNLESQEFFRGQAVGHTLLCLTEGVASALGARFVEAEAIPVGVSQRFLNIFFKKHGYEADDSQAHKMRKDFTKNPVSTLFR